MRKVFVLSGVETWRRSRRERKFKEGGAVGFVVGLVVDGNDFREGEFTL